MASIDQNSFEPKYDVFISYRHGDIDAVVAENLHKLLEGFRTPRALVRRGVPRRLTRVFRDREELPTSSDLSESILEALKSSRFMVVICSPRSLQSKWISKEIEIFQALGRSKQILTLLIDGEPAEAFPSVLIEKRRVRITNAQGEEQIIEQLSEPLAADIRASNISGRLKLLKSEVLRLLAPVLGCGFDDLRQREQARARERLVALTATLTFATAVFAGLAIFAGVLYFDAEAQRKDASEQRVQALTSAEKARTSQRQAEENAAVSERLRREGLVAEADRVAALSQQLISSDRPDIAAAVALEVAPHGDRDARPLTEKLGASLRRAYSHLRMPNEVNLGDNVLTIALSPDGLTLAAGDITGVVHILDAVSLEEKFRFTAGEDVVTGLSFSKDSERLIAAGSKIPVVWNVVKKEKQFDLLRPNPKSYSRIAVFDFADKYIAVATAENRALLYDGKSGLLIHELPGPSFEETVPASARNDSEGWASDPIVMAVAKATWQIFGVATDVAFSPDGTLLAVTGSPNPDGAVRLFNTKTGILVKTLHGRFGSLMNAGPGYGSKLAFTPDGKTLAAAPTSRAINVWSVEDGRLKTELPAIDINAFSLTKDGRGLVSAQSNGSIIVQCIDAASSPVTWLSHTREVQQLTTDQSGYWLVSLSLDRTARVWLMPKGEEICPSSQNDSLRKALSFRRPIAVLSGHGARVTSAAFSHDMTVLTTSSQDGFVRTWKLNSSDSKTFSKANSNKPATRDPTSIEDIATQGNVAVDEDNKTVLINLQEGGDWVRWDTSLNQTVQLFQGIKRFGYSDIVAPSRQQIVTRAGDFNSQRKNGSDSLQSDTNILVDVASQRVLTTLLVDDFRAEKLLFSADSSRLVGRMENSTKGESKAKLAVWEAATGGLIAVSDDIDDFSNSVVVTSSRNGSLILLANHDKSKLFEISENKLRAVRIPPTGASFSLARSIEAISLSASGEFIAAGHNDGTIAIVSVQSGYLIQVLDTRSLSIEAVSFSPNGKYLAAIDQSDTLWIFDIETGVTIRSHTLRTKISAFRFFPNSSHVLIGDIGGKYDVLPIRPELPGIADALGVSDWMRGSQLISINDEDSQRYGIGTKKRVRRSVLDTIEATRVPPIVRLPSPGPEATACDLLADNPFDRARRTSGVPFEKFDGIGAQEVCRNALDAYPNDRATQYHIARIHDRLGEKELAIAKYRSLGEDNYAIALRGVARLIEESQGNEFSSLGSAASWYERAAKAGDPWALATVASQIAIKSRDKIPEVLSLIAAAGIENRSEALMFVGSRIGPESDDLEMKKASLFYLILGLELDRSTVDPAPFQNMKRKDNARDWVRALATLIAPSEFLGVYRNSMTWISSLETLPVR